MITIERNELIYIYIQRKIDGVFGFIEHTFSNIDAVLLFDDKEKWVGIQMDLSPIDSLYTIEELTQQNDYDYFTSVKGNQLSIFFEENHKYVKTIEQKSSIDIFGGIYGIEIILNEDARISENRYLMKPEERNPYDKEFARLEKRLKRIELQLRRDVNGE